MRASESWSLTHTAMDRWQNLNVIYSYVDPDRNMSVLFNFHDIKVTENIKFISLFIQLCSSNILMYVRIFPSYIRHKPIENWSPTRYARILYLCSLNCLKAMPINRQPGPYSNIQFTWNIPVLRHNKTLCISTELSVSVTSIFSVLRYCIIRTKLEIIEGECIKVYRYAR